MGRPNKLELDEFLWRAMHLFWLRGSDAVSTRDLERALDLRAPAIYRRFRSKNELLARCVDHYVDRVVSTRVRRYLDDSDDPLQGLHAFFISALDPHPHEPGLRGCLLANTAAHADAHQPEIRDAIHRGWDVIDAAFQRQIERAQQAEQIDPELDPEAVGQALVMSLEGLLTLARASDTDLRPGIDATFRLLGGQRGRRPTARRGR